jgi:hypothetical protein
LEIGSELGLDDGRSFYNEASGMIKLLLNTSSLVFRSSAGSIGTSAFFTVLDLSTSIHGPFLGDESFSEEILLFF